MDFEEAVSAHQKWKSHLRVHINGSSTEMFETDLVGQDGLCELGKWIHGEGEQTMSHKPEFQAMKRTHARFHTIAAEVLRKSKEGDPHGACLLLDGPFYEASIEVMGALEKCKSACAADGPGGASPPPSRKGTSTG